MKYVGSKNRLSKELAPIIQSYVDNPLCQGYIEPFVGGANMIDKIKCKKKIGYDIHKYLIALLNKVRDNVNDLPGTIDKNMYNYVREHKDDNSFDDWFIGLVGFCASYNGKWFGGYANNVCTKIGTIRNYTDESIRNLKKQSVKLKGTNFICKDFRSIKDIKGQVIYCDPPYRDTTKYATNDFPYDEFYEWCRKFSKNNIVLISEYWMPDDFECIWQKTVKTSLNNNRGSNNNKTNRIEKLWKLKE